jgi:hypothetical protein
MKRREAPGAFLFVIVRDEAISMNIVFHSVTLTKEVSHILHDLSFGEIPPAPE